MTMAVGGTCPKCGGDFGSPEYVKLGIIRLREYLCYVCKRCSYAKTIPTLDRAR